MYKIYIVKNLVDAREFLQNYKKPLIISNTSGSIRHYGVMVLDYIFQKLLNEFSHIKSVLFYVSDDHAAFFSVIKLGYKDILYTGASKEVKRIITNINS